MTSGTECAKYLTSATASKMTTEASVFFGLFLSLFLSLALLTCTSHTENKEWSDKQHVSCITLDGISHPDITVMADWVLKISYLFCATSLLNDHSEKLGF